MSEKPSRLEIPSIFLNSAGIICSLGVGLQSVEANLFGDNHETCYLKQSSEYSTDRHLPLGLIDSSLAVVPIADEDTRNNRVLTTALTPMLPEIEDYKTRFGSHRIAVVIGTSTSGISDGEEALSYQHRHNRFPSNYHYRKQEISSPSRYVAQWLGLSGPVFSVSSACASGAKALTSAARLLQLGVCDVVIAGGVDTICHMTVQGFSSLEITSESACNPFSKNRNGMNIGEGAGLFILTREFGPVRLASFGETSDAHHISAPHPEGVGAEGAMRQALRQANMTPEMVNYINFHGTATEHNDKMEAWAVHRVFGADIACSSTKPLTGHTLAAAGAIEAVFCWLALQRDDGKLPPHHWDGEFDSALPPLNGIAKNNINGKLITAMSNSFAFGGNNASLIFSRA